MKMGSLFDGAGTCCFAAELCGITPVWSSEIEKFPLAVTAKRFPQVKQLGDITKIDGAEIEPVDIISFGSPCQDLSVAGTRKGFDGERSVLFLEAVRIIKEMRYATANEFPRYAVWENVSELSAPTEEKISSRSSRSCAKSATIQPQFLDLREGAALLDGAGLGSSWQTGIPWLGASSTLNFGECPKNVEESTLSQILEADVPPKYYLSARACRGILQRAVRRGTRLQVPLLVGLMCQGRVTTREAMEMGISLQLLQEIITAASATTPPSSSQE